MATTPRVEAGARSMTSSMKFIGNESDEAPGLITLREVRRLLYVVCSGWNRAKQIEEQVFGF